MAAFDSTEEMHAESFDLIAAGTPQRRIAEKIEIGLDLVLIERPHCQLCLGKMVPDPFTVAKHHGGCQKPVRASLKPRQLRRGAARSAGLPSISPSISRI